MSIMIKVAELEKNNRDFALATIIESKGSTPRHVGKMIVYLDGSIQGTIGGGLAESYVIQEAISVIKKGQSKCVEYTLNQDVNGGISMHCGGTLKVFIEAYVSKPELVFVGGGHLAMALSQLCDLLEYPYKVVDDRPDYCTEERFPRARAIYTDTAMDKAVTMAGLSHKSYVTIFTKDCDDVALYESLKYKCAYIGMIGSSKKVKRIKNKLLGQGVAAEALEQVHTPIGLSIGAETPAEIAISIMAEVIAETKKK